MGGFAPWKCGVEIVSGGDTLALLLAPWGVGVEIAGGEDT